VEKVRNLGLGLIGQLSMLHSIACRQAISNLLCAISLALESHKNRSTLKIIDPEYYHKVS